MISTILNINYKRTYKHLINIVLMSLWPFQTINYSQLGPKITPLYIEVVKLISLP